jgi:hypothetical protein
MPQIISRSKYSEENVNTEYWPICWLIRIAFRAPLFKFCSFSPVTDSASVHGTISVRQLSVCCECSSLILSPLIQTQLAYFCLFVTYITVSFHFDN